MTQTTIKPLTGKRILVTRASTDAAILSRKLQNLGATTIEVPTIEIQSPQRMEEMNTAIENIQKYDWIIFTSAHGVESFIDRMAALRVSMDSLRNAKIAAIGPATSESLQRAGRNPDFVPEKFLSEFIAQGLGDLQGKRILLPRADIASKQLPSLLSGKGAIVDQVTAYRTVIPNELTSEKLKAAFDAGVDLITFTSPSTVHNFFEALGNNRNYLNNVKVACIGPITFEAAKEEGIIAHLVADPHTIDALVEAIENEIGTI